MIEIKKEINTQLLSVLKKIDDSKLPPQQTVAMLSEITHIHSLINK